MDQFKVLIFILLFQFNEGITDNTFADNETLSRFEEIRQLYPSVSQIEAKTMRLSPSDNDNLHPCKRKCVAGVPMTCYYYFVVHYDETMTKSCDRYLDPKYRFKAAGREYIDRFMVRDANTHDDCKFADGVRNEMMVVNGRLPGPTINVCNGDTVVVDVINSLHEPTTIHWHGMHQRKTPHMDGVPHITQYPIEAGQAFRYKFEVDHAGTHWWHSHVDHQRGFGLAGAFIVREPPIENLHAKLYDFDYSEHVLEIQDWAYNYDESVPKNLLINGMGRNVQNRTRRPTLYETFNVVRGGRYRFRVIFNGVANCPISLTIDNHDLIVIASDGNDIEPVIVQKLIFHAGERFDFVLHANQPVANYWLRLKGYGFCSIDKLHQEAIIRYQGANRAALEPRSLSYAYEATGIELNSVDYAPSGDKNRIALVELNAMEKRLAPPLTPYRTIYTSMAVSVRGVFLFQMDYITFTMPKVSLLQTRNLGIGPLFCNKTQQAALGFNCRSRHCKCTNVIQVPAFKNIEFVISSESNSAHPIHIHGFTFRVVGMGVLGEDRIKMIEEIDRQTPLPRRRSGAPLKDTVHVPAFGYTILRFYTDNPGYWMFHCHISSHSENGMSAVIRVGDDQQMKMCPVSNCGLCSSAL